MGIATKGGGAVSSGPANKTLNDPATKSTGVAMMAKGGMAKKMNMGGMAMDKMPMSKMAKGGMAKGKMAKKGKKMNMGGYA
jgi:hypothetical protein